MSMMIKVNMFLANSAKRNIGKAVKLLKRGFSSSQFEDQDGECEFEENHHSSVFSPNCEIGQDINSGKENGDYSGRNTAKDIKANRNSSARKRYEPIYILAKRVNVFLFSTFNAKEITRFDSYYFHSSGMLILD